MPANLPAYAFFILFVIAVIAIYLVVLLYSQERKRRARALRSLHVDNKKSEDEHSESGFANLSRDLLVLMGIDIAKKRKENYSQFGRAGIFSEDAVAKFLFFRYIVQPIIAFIGLIILFVALTSDAGFSNLDNLLKILTGGVCAFFGISGHNMVLDKLGNRRKQKLILDFPDAVDLLLICVESGMGLDAALSRVSKELTRTHPNVVAEFERTRIELGLFGDRVQALQNLAERTDIQSYRSLVSALVQTEKYGTNLAATLRTLSSEYRDQRLLKAEEKAARVGPLMTLPAILGILVPVMIFILMPPLIPAFSTSLGG